MLFIVTYPSPPELWVSKLSQRLSGGVLLLTGYDSEPLVPDHVGKELGGILWYEAGVRYKCLDLLPNCDELSIKGP